MRLNTYMASPVPEGGIFRIRRVLGHGPWWLAEVTWPRIAAIVAICALMTPFNELHVTEESVLRLFKANLVTFAPGFILVLIGEALRLENWRQWAFSTCALLIGGGLSIALNCVVEPGWAVQLFGEQYLPLCDAGAFAAMRRHPGVFLGPVVIGTILLLLLRGHRRHVELTAFLYDLQQRRVDAQRRSLDAELKGLQARVEPEFLFDAIGAIRDRCVASPDSAQRLLERLIDHLRAALPRADSKRSTLHQEVSVVKSWLDVRAAVAGTGSKAAFNVSDEASLAAFPPMILLPLVRQLSAAGTDGVQLDAHVRGNAVQLVLTARGHMAPAQAVAEIRERLNAIYGGRASLQWGDAPRTQLVLEVPYEHGDGDHR